MGGRDDARGPVGTGAALMAKGWRFYGITTADRPERRAAMERELGRHGIVPTVHVSQRPSDAGGFESVGVRGCFESHLECLRTARAEGARVAVVAEDDVMVMSAFDRVAPAIDGWLRDRDWLMLYLGYLEDQSPLWTQPVEQVGDHVVASLGWEVQGSHFYAVHHTALDALIADFEARLEPGGHKISSDGVLNEFQRDQGSRPLLCLPNLAHQAPSVSGIAEGSSLRNRVLAVPAAAKAIGIAKRLQRERRGRQPVPEAARAWNERAAAATATP